MYGTNKIIGVVGRTCSGKSSLLNMLAKSTLCVCIDLDKLDLEAPKIERKRILAEHGILYLNEFIYPQIKKELFRQLDMFDNRTIVIEGVLLKKYFTEIVDVFIEFNVPIDIRKENALKKGWSEEKFSQIEIIYDGSLKICGGYL